MLLVFALGDDLLFLFFRDTLNHDPFPVFCTCICREPEDTSVQSMARRGQDRTGQDPFLFAPLLLHAFDSTATIPPQHDEQRAGHRIICCILSFIQLQHHRRGCP